MTTKNDSFAKGDWIVHTFYGVGQITGIESKELEDSKTRYYRVKGRNSTFFIPVDNADNDRIRPVASRYKLRKAVKVLKEKPRDLEPDHNARKKQIAVLVTESDLEVTAELVRDLASRRANHGLNDNEEKVLENLSNRMVREWSITEEIDIDKAREKFDTALENAREPIPTK